MPCCGGGERRIDKKALETYLRSRGLVPRTGKWEETWHKKRHKFTTYV